MPRYEYSDDKSNKFWDISLDGSEVTTRWGKIGADGQTKTKSFDDGEAARKEYDKQIAGKVKKGYELADKAFSVNPLDPKLTPEQRKQVVQMHAAVRNRSAAFGRLVYQNSKLANELATLKAELAKFGDAQPGAAGGHQPASTPGHTSAKDSVLGALYKLAR